MGVIKYLVLKKLSGKEHYLRALFDYLVGNESPSELERKYNINRRLIASMKQSLKEKSIYGLDIAKRAIPIILKTPMPQLTIATNGEISFYCKLCRTIYYNMYPEDHIVKKHQIALKYYTILVKMQLKQPKGWGLE